MKNQTTPPRTPLRQNDGGLLPAALLLTIIASVWLGSFVHLTQNEVRVSLSALNFNSSLNLAEGAAEHAIHAIHHKQLNSWPMDGGAYVMNEIKVDLGRGIEGIMRARVYDYTGDPTDNPLVVAEGIVVQPNLPPATRRLEIRFGPRTLFDGLNATRFRANGMNTYVDSYDSSKGFYNDDYVDEDGNTRINISANATLASYSADASVDMGHAKIFGYVSIAPGTTFRRGQNGAVTDLYPIKHDPERVTNDYSSNFPKVVAPSTTVYLGKIDDETTLPLPGYSADTVYKIDSIKLTSKALAIDGPVTIVTGDVDIGGNGAGIVIGPEGSLKIYATEDIDIGGNGLVNLKDKMKPEDFQIFGVADKQDFKLGGNGAWSGAIYAPNADITLSGGGGGSGEFFGALVANELRLNGTYAIHVDLDLLKLTHDTFGVNDWREVFAAK